MIFYGFIYTLWVVYYRNFARNLKSGADRDEANITQLEGMGSQCKPLSVT